MTDAPQQYQQPYGQPAPASRFNVLAIIGFILAFVFWIAGIVVSAIALNQVKKSGERGRGLALWGLILSIVFGIINIISVIAVFSLAASQGVNTGY